MKMYVYKLNVFNPHETPWEGTRLCKKKNFKSFTHLRKKILIKNLKSPFWKINKPKDIKILKNGGWHFNNLYDLKTISRKLKSFPHKEFSKKKYSSLSVIKKKVRNLQDLFGRGHNYIKVKIDKNYPDYIKSNKIKLKKYIL